MSDAATIAKVLRQVGLLKVQNPVPLLKAGKAIRKWGPGFPAGVHAAAARAPRQTAIVDDVGEITWIELQAEINRATAALKRRGVEPGTSVALLARNHRWTVIAQIALMQCGARLLMLNTMASGAQLVQLLEREGADLLVVDEEFVPRLDLGAWGDRVILAWSDRVTGTGESDEPSTLPALAEEMASQSDAEHDKPAQSAKVVIFTSGTTGLPKGAKREEPRNLKPLISVYDAIPYPANQRVVLPAPLFHSWGLMNFGFALLTAPTFILRRKFDPVETIRDIDRYQATTLVVVPLMMQRMVDAAPEVIDSVDVSSLKVTGASGSALPGELAIKFMDTFTDSIYNFYGATETGWVSIAGPEDLRAAPGTAGRVPWRTTVKLFDADGKEVPQGQPGVIHVVNDLPFGGYTDGQEKSFIDGMMSTGDVGYFDAEGRLFVSGRDDDMVIVGGENVFPRELEDALFNHPEINDVAVMGIEDAEWGQRLAAWVVREPGSSIDRDQIVAYAKDRVARFAVPGQVRFVDELPRNPTGKVLRRELADLPGQ